MTPAPGTMVRLARLRHEMSADLEALNARAAELDKYFAPAVPTSADRTTGIVAAVNIHAWYTALETTFERVARLLDDSVPCGPAWHAELISQMSVHIPGLRPALIEDAQALELEELRKFRHFFRNAYVLEFDFTRIADLAGRVLRIHPTIAAKLEQLIAHLSAVLQSLEHS